MSKPATTDAPTTLKIAVATGDSTLGEFLVRVLPALGHSIHSASADGGQLVQNCRLQPPDLLIVDEQLQGQAVSETLARVREFASAPAILISEGLPAAATEKITSLGVTSNLKKPITESEL